MNLAVRDIRYSPLKFFRTIIGASLLIMVVVARGGIMRAVILDSATIVEATGADLCMVQAHGTHPQGGTREQFVETSRLPEYLYHAIEVMPGVA